MREYNAWETFRDNASFVMGATDFLWRFAATLIVAFVAAMHFFAPSTNANRTDGTGPGHWRLEANEVEYSLPLWFAETRVRCGTASVDFDAKRWGVRESHHDNPALPPSPGADLTWDMCVDSDKHFIDIDASIRNGRSALPNRHNTGSWADGLHEWTAEGCANAADADNAADANEHVGQRRLSGIGLGVFCIRTEARLVRVTAATFSPDVSTRTKRTSVGLTVSTWLWRK